MKALSVIMTVVALMSAPEIVKILNRQALNGASPATLYNLGFELYYRHGFEPKAIVENLIVAYGQARGVTPEQQNALNQAAAFWKRELANWKNDVVRHRNVPGNMDNSGRKVPNGFTSPLQKVPLAPTPRD